MRILYDHQLFSEQVRGGASRYFFEVYKRLKHYEDVEAKCSVLLSVNGYLNEASMAPFRTTPNGFPEKPRVLNAINLISSKIALTKGNFDIFHPTYYKPYYLRHRLKKPVVVTCLDMIHEKFFQNDSRTINNKRRTLLRATKIVAISQNTKNDLVELYNLPEEKVVVSHLASSLKAPSKDELKAARKGNYFLFVGTRQYYKNFIGFVRAIAPLLKRTSGLQLLCIGGGAFSPEEKALFIELGITDRLRQQSTSDEELASIYAGAIAFFFPSLYEGFGIPVLEAMSCGCPAVISENSSLTEVGGSAALYFNPSDTESIYSAAEKILLDENLRNDLIIKGFEREKAFSWDQTARQHYDLYKTLL